MEDLCTYNHPDPNTPGRVIPINFHREDAKALILGIADAAQLTVIHLPPVADATDPMPGEVTFGFRPVTPTPEPPAKPAPKPKGKGK